jgi:hypothetical protein
MKRRLIEHYEVVRKLGSGGSSDSVPQGRLNLAQDVSPGNTSINSASPEGTAEDGWEQIQPSLRD